MTRNLSPTPQLLIPLRQAAGRELTWRQPEALVYRWELSAGDDLLGVLEYPGWWKDRAEMHLAKEVWEFHRRGFFKQRIEISQPGKSLRPFLFEPGWFWQGPFRVPSGEILSWRSGNFWGTQWAFVGAGGVPLVQFMMGTGRFRLGDAFRQQARVRVSARAASRKDLGMLVGLGWYLIILRQRQSTAQTASTAAIS